MWGDKHKGRGREQRSAEEEDIRGRKLEQRCFSEDFSKDGDDVDDDNEVEIGTNLKMKNIGKVCTYLIWS